MSKWAELDDAIVRELSQSREPWRVIDFRMQEEFPALYAGRGKDAWRTTDRRLQALRKAGRIKPARVGGVACWEIVW